MIEVFSCAALHSWLRLSYILLPARCKQTAASVPISISSSVHFSAFYVIAYLRTYVPKSTRNNIPPSLPFPPPPLLFSPL